MARAKKFESQTPTVQKAIVIGGIALLALFLLSFPMGYLSTSGDNMAGFAENRRLIQGLFACSRSAKEAAPLPPPHGRRHAKVHGRAGFA